MSIDQDKGFFYSLQLKRNGVDQSQWPQLTCSKASQLTVTGALNVDQDNTNNGLLHPGIIFGSTSDDPNAPQSGEGIASKRTSGGNQNGLDFYTGSTARVSISNAGNVGIGTGITSPAARLHIFANDNDALKITNTVLSKTARMGVDSLGVWIEPTETNSSIRLNANPSFIGLYVRGTDGNIGIGTTTQRNPLGIRARGVSEELISFESPNGTTKWHINQNLGGSLPGLNFVETAVADGRLFIQSGGNVGIGTTEPYVKLHVDAANSAIGVGSTLASGQATGLQFLNYGTQHAAFRWSHDGSRSLVLEDASSTHNPTTWYAGNPVHFIVRNGNIVASTLIQTCSREFKENISQLSSREAIEALENLDPVTFNYKADREKELHLGFIAEDVPDLVATTGRKGLSVMDIVAVLTKVVKEQQNLIAVLAEKVKALEADN